MRIENAPLDATDEHGKDSILFPAAVDGNVLLKAQANNFMKDDARRPRRGPSRSLDI
jgi:hypothetical protein